MGQVNQTASLAESTLAQAAENGIVLSFALPDWLAKLLGHPSVEVVLKIRDVDEPDADTNYDNEGQE